MPFKMIANRSVYRIDDGKEYKKDEKFTVATEKERDRLVRNKRARPDETKEEAVKPVEVPRAPVVQKVMTVEQQPAPPPTPPETTADSQSDAPSTGYSRSSKSNRYRRSDMRSED